MTSEPVRRIAPLGQASVNGEPQVKECFRLKQTLSGRLPGPAALRRCRRFIV